MHGRVRGWAGQVHVDVGAATSGRASIRKAIQMRSAAKGGASLWAGLPSTFVLGLPFALLFHGAQGTTSMWMHEKGWDAAEPLVAATAGSVLASLVGVPLEVIKHRTQLLGSTSALQVAAQVMSTEGLRGLYRGSAATLLRNVVYNGAQWTTFAAAQGALRAATDRGGGGGAGGGARGGVDWRDVLAGMGAGASTAVLTQPIDCVNTRLQTQTLIQGRGRAVYTGMVDCARQTIAKEGVGALFRGLAPRAITFSVGGAAFFLAYEAALHEARRAFAHPSQAHQIESGGS
ncbi:mitochondrial carrier domain-containing protein [Baffinella frigidus]|nr:mitochondrial carrier domain-containing protein [Cryptophyta sp. CCMP2293]